MKVAILGYGVEGKSAEAYWQSKGAEVTIRDQKLSPDYLQNLDQFDLIVRSPGIKPGDVKTTKPVTSVIKEFMDQCPAPIIGVTGTKGKGTTSTLIARILEAAGHRVWLGGNIGKPALDFLADVKATDYVVLELSSFQLIDLDRSPHIGVMLMVVPEHMDYHQSFEEYTEAKGNLFRFQTESDLAVYNAQNTSSTQLAALSKASKLPYGDPSGAWVDGDKIKFQQQIIMPTSEVGLLGKHNLENVCAAISATQEIVKDLGLVRQVVQSFKGLEHRLEFVRDVGMVKYYDDSFSTTPETAMAAISAIPQPKVLILGGSDKGSDYSDLGKAIKVGNVRKALVIGDVAKQIIEALNEAGFVNIETNLTSMKDIVAVAQKTAHPGDVVLLSPACASFGLFADYKDRGEQFKRAVNILP